MVENTVFKITVLEEKPFEYTFEYSIDGNETTYHDKNIYLSPWGIRNQGKTGIGRNPNLSQRWNDGTGT